MTACTSNLYPLESVAYKSNTEIANYQAANTGFV